MMRKGQAEIIGAAFFVLIAFAALFAFYLASTQYVALMNAENQRAQLEQQLAQERILQLTENVTQSIFFNVSGVSPSPGSPPYLYRLDGYGLAVKGYSLSVNISVPFSATGLVVRLSGVSKASYPAELYVYARAQGSYVLVAAEPVLPGSAFQFAVPVSPEFVSGKEVELLINASTQLFTSAGQVYAANIVITNRQPAPTPEPFQQLINVTSTSPIWSYINTSSSGFGQNVLFTYNGQIVPSWLESYSLNTNPQYAVWWVNIPTGVPANSSIVITAVLYPKSVNLYSVYPGLVGEAPELSPSYGEYDSGYNVFLFYDDFAGTSLNTKLWVNNVNNASGSLSIDNGMVYTATSSSNKNYPFIYSYAKFSEGVVEAYGYIPPPNSTSTNLYIGFGLASQSNFLQNLAGVGDFYDKNTKTIITGLATSTSNGNINLVSGLNSGLYIWQIYVPPSGSSTPSAVYASQNYHAEISSTNDMPTLPQPIVFFATQSKSSIGPIYWVRVRAYPPNGVMPSVSIGFAGPSMYQLALSTVVPVNLSSFTFYSIQALGQISFVNENLSTFLPSGFSYYLISPPLNNSNTYTFSYALPPSFSNATLILDVFNTQGSADLIKVSWPGGSFSTVLLSGRDERLAIPLTGIYAPGGSFTVTVSGNVTTGVDEAVVQAIVPHVVAVNAGPYPVEIIRVWSLGQPPTYENVTIYLQPGQIVDLSGYFRGGAKIIKVVTSYGGQYSFYC